MILFIFGQTFSYDDNEEMFTWSAKTSFYDAWFYKYRITSIILSI